MNEKQMKRINEEIARLTNKKINNDIVWNYPTISDSRIYIDGRIDSLKWVKENI